MPTVIRHITAALLLERGGDFLLRAEAENNLILGICGDLAGNPPADDKQPWLLTIEQNEAVIGVAIMVPPRRLVITRLSAAASTSLVEYLFHAKLAIPGVVGPSPDVSALAEPWAQINKLRASLSMDQRIYSCDRVIPPPFLPSPGRLRAADPADRGLLVAWSRDFHVAVHMSDTIAECDVLIDRLIARRAIWIWDDDEPVSCAAFARETSRGVGINHVYTPPHHRGRGYASTCVAALTTSLLDSGRSFCCLYSDLGNPTSNRIYQQIGYQPVCDSQLWRFE
jgi:predicted GNAT family acetyltransferase